MSALTIQRGLLRLSAVFWGFFILLGVLWAGVGVFGPNDRAGVNEIVWMGLVGAAIAWAGYKVTCWLINGFFASSH
jgi:hypothetical protein